jgi:hypothetical protein
MTQGSPVEFRAEKLPLRQVMIHIRAEALIVMAFQQVRHFMDDHVSKFRYCSE